MSAPDKSQWQPILNEQQEQVGWVIDGKPIKFSSPEVFTKATGYLEMASRMKARKQHTRAKVAKKERGK